MTDQTVPCRTTRHCADHGFCHRCTPALGEAIRHLVKAISAAGIEYPASSDLYARLAAGVRDAARQAAGQPAAECVCEHPKSMHGWLGCNGHWGPEDGCGCTWNEHLDVTPAVGGQDAGQPADRAANEVILPPTTQFSYRLEHRHGDESTWRRGVPGLGIRWTYADWAKADQRLAEARAQWPQYEHRMVTITTTVTEAVVDEDEAALDHFRRMADEVSTP
jgi:hypothetical protein